MLHVLIADNDDSAREDLQARLAQEGYDLIVPADGLSPLEMVNTAPVCSVFLERAPHILEGACVIEVVSGKDIPHAHASEYLVLARQPDLVSPAQARVLEHCGMRVAARSPAVDDVLALVRQAATRADDTAPGSREAALALN